MVSPRRSRLLLWSCGLVAASILCLPEWLIRHHRSFYQRHFPEAAAAWALNGSYTSLSPADDPDTHSWAARIRDAGDHGWPQDPHIKENRSARLATLDGLIFFLLGRLQALTGDISATWMIARFLGVLGCFVGLAALMTRLSGNQPLALAAAALPVFYYDLTEDLIVPFVTGHPAALPKALKDALAHAFWFLGTYHQNFGMSRLIRPALTYPFLFAAAYAASRTVSSHKGALLFSGFVGGGLAYIHSDVWFVYVVGVAIFFALWSLTEKRPNLPLAASGAVSAALSLPFLKLNGGTDKDMLIRSSAGFSRHVDLFGLAYLAAGLALARRFKDEPLVVMLSCLVAASGLALEVQLLTGYNVDPVRWHSLAWTFGGVLAVGLWGRRLQPRRDYLWVFAALCALSVGRMISYAAQRFPFQALPRDLEQAFAFLAEKTPPDSVVVSLGPQETMLIPVHSRNKTYLGSGCILVSDLPTDDNLRRLRRALELYGIPEKEMLARLGAPELLKPQGLAKWNRDFWIGKVDWRDLEWSTFYHFYTLALDHEDVFKRLKAMEGSPLDRGPQADYLWVGPFERELIPASALKRLGKPLFQNATISLFPLKP